MTQVQREQPADGPPAPLNELSSRRAWGVLESAPDGMLMTDGNGVILAVNQQVERLFGYDRADLLGREIEILLPEHLHHVHRAHRTRYRAEPMVRAMGGELQLRARRSDGSEFPVEVSLSPLQDDDGFAVVASIRDVTERERATAYLRRIQAAIDAVHDGVFMFEANTLRFVYANDGASVQTGYSHDELLTMTPLHIKPEFTREEFDALIAPVVNGEIDHLAFRTIHRSKSGHDMPVDILLECRRDADNAHESTGVGTNPLLVAIVRDVTEQVAVEQQLALSEQTFRTSFEQAPVGMSVARVLPDGMRILERVNESFTRMLGRSVDALIGSDFIDITHPDDRQQSIDAWVEMSDGTRNAFIREQRYLRADGEYVWALVHASVIERVDGIRTLTHIVDITDRRERQAERVRVTTMEDRERIARDLHDLVIQRLFGAGMKLQAVIPQMGSETAVARTYETIDELDMTIRELRSAIFSLHRRDSDRSAADDLELAVEQAVDRLGFRPTLVLDGPLGAVAEKQVVELEATVREALSNAARHAGASAVEVRVEVTHASVNLAVIDDGSGVDPARPHGNGLRNMAERASRLGGSFELDTAEAGGCTLRWSVPR
ncbi:MAG: two-component system sensor histidine kinase DevS [Ilumatobacter sp.]